MTRTYLFSVSALALVVAAAALPPVQEHARARQQPAKTAAARPARSMALPAGPGTAAASSRFAAQPLVALGQPVYGLAARANDGPFSPASRPGMFSRSWGSIKRMFL